MSISVEWADEAQTRLLLTYHKGWTWSDFFATSPRVAEFLDTVDHPVDSIHDVHDSTIPSNVISQFPKFTRGSVSLKHPNARYIVMVGPTPYLRMLVEIFQKMYRNWSERVILTTTLEQAYAALEKRTTEPITQ